MKRVLFPLLLFAAACGLASFLRQPSAVTGSRHLSARYAGRTIISCSPFMSYVPTDFLMTQIGHRDSIGSISFPITTSNAEAQFFFNQGMAFLYSFEYVQSARSFYTALAKDSNAAMIYWGLSETYQQLDDSTMGRELAAKAMSKAVNVQPSEQMLIRLMAGLVKPAYDSSAIEDKRHTLQAMADSANAMFAGDAEVWSFTGRMRAFGEIGPGNESYKTASRHAIDDYLMKALDVEPAHFGVWHYLIHFNEANSDFNKALSYGKLYTNAAPQVAHAWHMYAHDLMKTGRVNDAIDQFNHAFELENKKYVNENMPAKYDWHHSHNMELLAYCYQYKGKFADAERVFSILDTLTAFTPRSESKIRKGHPYFYLQTGQPAKAKAMALPLIASPRDENHFTGHFIAGVADLFLHDEKSAMDHYQQMMHITDSIREESIRMGLSAELADEDLGYLYAQAGIIQMGAGLMRNPDDSLMVAKMNAIQKTLLRQTGPDPWIDALYFLQLLTELSISTGNINLAEASAKNMLLHDAGYPGAYLLMARIKNKQGDKSAAGLWLEKARIGYSDADPKFKKAIKL